MYVCIYSTVQSDLLLVVDFLLVYEKGGLQDLEREGVGGREGDVDMESLMIFLVICFQGCLYMAFVFCI